jgi:glycosyltransferase involved in cell wall biosynthesis
MKLKVTYFQRKPHIGFNFSLEAIFVDLRKRLKDKIQYNVKVCSYYNAGFLSIILNVIEAFFRQNKGIKHITGEVHFLSLLMRSNKIVLTILDCGMMHRKKGISQLIVNLIYLKWPVKKATIITAISEETKKEIILFTGNSTADIRVIPVAIHRVFKPLSQEFNQVKPIILQIGTGANKNIFRLIQALEGLNCSLSIVGKLSQEHKEALEKYKIEYTNGVNLTQTQIIEQYKSCDILSFISTREGFGMPIVEANAVERVVITSKISSMPEIAGDAACFVDPFDIESIRNGFINIISDENYRNKLIENGRENKKRFDPEKIASQYLEIYQELNNN